MGMTQTIRAVYEDGHLRLLDPIDLNEGEEVQVTILSDRERVRAALGDLVVQYPVSDDDDIDEEALLREIEEGFKGVTLSDVIIGERREGP
jgi:predicted DNA-binding antitoxin AbrB/MazE fold protein